MRERVGLMGWLARIFANALARRLAAVIVAGVLAWVGIGTAKAQTYSSIGRCDYGQNCTQPQAWAEITSVTAACGRWSAGSTATVVQAAHLSGSTYRTAVKCEPKGSSANIFYWYTVFYSGCPAGQEFNSVRGACQKTCSSQAQRVVSYQSMIPSGSYACVDGCTARVTPNGDGTYSQSFLGGEPSHCLAMPKHCPSFGAGYGMNYGTSMCQPPFVECQENEVKDPISGTCTQGCEPGMLMDANGVCKPKEDQCPPGNVKSPAGGCLPGDGQCAIGEVKGKDGTCKRDADGDGQPDPGEEEGTTDETFSGGDSCDAPPACSGSPIMCGQARIQWRIDCNTRKNREVTGGACNNVPLCIGKNCDALEYASLLQQWKASCALEKLVAKGAGEGEDGIKDHMTALKQAEVNALRALGQDDGHGDVDPDGIWAKDADYGDGKLDKGLFGGGGGTCDLSFTIGGNVVSPSAQFWRIVSIIHWLLIASAYLWVASKLG